MTPGQPRRPRLRPLLPLLLATVAACDGAPRLGPTPVEARRNAADLAGGLAARFMNVERTPAFTRARARMSRGALAPSVIWDDQALWPVDPRSRDRMLGARGRLAGEAYRLGETTDLRPPEEPGEARHLFQLRRLPAPDQYEWNTRVDFAVGPLRPTEFAGLFGAALASAERGDERALLARAREQYPRTGAALGKLFTLDSLRPARLADGSTAVSMVFSAHPERLRQSSPAVAGIVARYLEHSRWRWRWTDALGVRVLDLSGAQGRYVLRARVLQGRLVPLDGPLRAFPDSIRFQLDFRTKLGPFTVGFRDARGRGTVLRTPTQFGVAFHFDVEPDWDLPLFTEQLVRTPLRRPFEGDGARFALSLRTDVGPQSVLSREIRMAVHESRIVRWLGALGNDAFLEYVGKAEAQENAWNREIFTALQGDWAAALR